METIQQLQPKDFTPTLGAYSHGIKVPLPGADMVLVTGQIAMEKNGQVVAPNDPVRQTEFIFENIQKILAEGGLSLQDVVKTQIFLTKMDDFSKVSEIRNKYFGENKPVSTLVEVNRFVKDGCCVEIEVMAVRLKG